MGSRPAIRSALVAVATKKHSLGRRQRSKKWVQVFDATIEDYRSVRLAIGVRSVDNDKDARWLSQCFHGSFGSSINVNPRFPGWLLLVIGARPVKLSIAQHNAALGKSRTLQFCDGLGIGSVR